MSSYGYMTIEGEKQGLISAGCSTQASIGNKCQTVFADQIMVLGFAHNMANTENAMHATHRPVFITKLIDKSSPLLAQALTHREKLKCTINFFRTAPSGGQEKFYTIQLEGCLIRELIQDMPHIVEQSDGETQELLAVSYRDISWVHHTGGTTGGASWGGGS